MCCHYFLLLFSRQRQNQETVKKNKKNSDISIKGIVEFCFQTANAFKVSWLLLLFLSMTFLVPF